MRSRGSACPREARHCALLTVSHAPHFKWLARLIDAAFALAVDAECFEFFAVLSSHKEATAFRRLHQASASAVTLLDLDTILSVHANTTYSSLVEHRWQPRGRHYWTQNGATQALKKLYGMLELHARGFATCWFFDSESLPFRPFSYGAYFAEWSARPVLLVNNASSPYMERFNLGEHVGVRAITRALRIERAVRDELVYHVADYWMVSLHGVAAMAAYTATAHAGLPTLADVFMCYPWSAIGYYGFYVEHVEPACGALPGATPCHERIVFPDGLDERLKRRMLPHTWRLDLSAELFGECATPIQQNYWDRRQKGSALSFEESIQLLSGPLAWHHGYRLDYIAGCEAHARALLHRLPHVTWATSNWNTTWRTSLDLSTVDDPRWD